MQGSEPLVYRCSRAQAVVWAALSGGLSWLLLIIRGQAGVSAGGPDWFFGAFLALLALVALFCLKQLLRPAVLLRIATEGLTVGGLFSGEAFIPWELYRGAKNLVVGLNGHNGRVLRIETVDGARYDVQLGLILTDDDLAQRIESFRSGR